MSDMTDPSEINVAQQQIESALRVFIQQQAGSFRAQDGTVLPPYSYESMVRNFLTQEHPQPLFPTPPPRGAS